MMTRWLVCGLAAAALIGAAPKQETPATGIPEAGAAQPAPAAQTPVALPKAEAPKAAQPPEMDVTVDSPTQVIQKYTEELRVIVDPEGSKDKGKRDAAKERRVADKVRQFFDFEGLARMALGRHWSRATGAQRREYKDLFVSLVEDSYLRRSRDIVGKYQIVYGREEVKKNQAKVHSRVVRNDADVEIVYQLHRNPKNWMIYNIVLDGVDLIKNYQSQFNSIIMKSGFDSLLSRLRKKKEEVGTEVNL
ncbi:MAG: ABC transporter substrate-binding protein [Pseudomonadota bacterium]